MSEQAPVVVEVKLLDLPQVLCLIDSAVATITALATALDNANEEIIRLRQEATEDTSINITVNVAESVEVQHE